MERIDEIIRSLIGATFWATLLGVILMFSGAGSWAGAFTGYAFVACMALILIRVLLI